MNTGDVLIVDSRDQIITLNGFDVSGQVRNGREMYPELVQKAENPLYNANNRCVVDSGDEHNRLKVDRYWRNYRC